MKVKLDRNAKMPTRAHDSDAGYDLYARDTQIVPPERVRYSTPEYILRCQRVRRDCWSAKAA